MDTVTLKKNDAKNSFTFIEMGSQGLICWGKGRFGPTVSRGVCYKERLMGKWRMLSLQADFFFFLCHKSGYLLTWWDHHGNLSCTPNLVWRRKSQKKNQQPFSNSSPADNLFEPLLLGSAEGILRVSLQMSHIITAPQTYVLLPREDIILTLRSSHIISSIH